MNSVTEKEKKLNSAINKLKNLILQNPTLKSNLENLNTQKNLLEIEKKAIEEKYQNLITEHHALSQKLKEINNQNVNEKKKETQFSEKIDELNQETDTLLDEIDKWQT